MKYFFISKIFFCFFLLSFSTVAQIFENFSDGNITNSPVWSGDVTQWNVVNGQLVSNGPAVSNTISYLSTPSLLTKNIEWEFFANLKLATSSSNYTDVFLMSDSANLKGKNEGYFIRIGGLNDEVSLFLKKATLTTKIIDGANKIISGSTNNPVKVKVQRTSTFQWFLYVDVTGIGNNYALQGTIIDSTIQQSAYFGILIKYSASNAHNFYYDDIYVHPIYKDTISPVVSEVSVISSVQVDVLFTENMDSISANLVSNYQVNNGIGQPYSATLDAVNRSLVHLIFTSALHPRINNLLSINNVMDNSNNSLKSSTHSVLFYIPYSYDVLINEIMADPDPSQGLPKYEYIELFNRMPFPISLNGWTITIGSSSKNLPDYQIDANDYLVISSLTGADSLKKYVTPKVLGISGFPVLTNTGTNVSINDNFGHIVSSVLYSDEWYQNANKKDGGWSLELMDPNNPCGGANNWKSSNNTNGGTPGQKNSVSTYNPDNKNPEVLRVAVLTAKYLQVFFDEPIDSITMIGLVTYSVNKGIGFPTQIECMAPDFLSVKLILEQPLDTGVIYSLSVGNLIRDCAGNTLTSISDCKFAIPSAPEKSDIVINEVLFDPQAGGVDFVEVYNRSEKVVDLMSLKLANADFISDIIDVTQTISTDGYLLFPNEYCVLTIRPDIVQHYYYSNNKAFIKMTKFPTLNAADGVVVLLNDREERIDEFRYTASMHFPLLKEVKGVSLERLDPDRPTQDSTNWHSAAQTNGFATPGYKNSQNSRISGGNAGISIDPEIFSPDNDGYKDVLNIRIQPDAPGFVGNVRIFDCEGREIIKLLKSELLGNENIVTWDGLTDNREKAHIGIYIILAEIFDLNGNVRTYKRSCVLAEKL